ncbi:MAG: S8 family serine peptidase, partial [candidate division SR1 bacterium]|nr:S8 family serine peptidase [candidate division SR1 bacterium]
MIFRRFKPTVLLVLLLTLIIGNISLFATDLKEETLDNGNTDVNYVPSKHINKPTTEEIANNISEFTTIDNTLLVKVKEGENVNDVKNELKDEISSKLKIDKKNIEDFDSSEDQTVALQFADKEKLKNGFKVAVNNDKVEIAQPNYKYKKMYTPNDTEFNNQWYLKNQASGVNATTAWDVMGAKAGVVCGDSSASAKRCGGENSVKIAVIDSGVNLNIADFAGASVDTANSMRFFDNVNASCPPNQTYIPANGLVVGQSFCQNIGSQYDEDGHGTGVASIIMSQDNAIGSVGIAHNTTLLPIALHNDTFNTFFISEAIKYAQSKGAKVINLSLGTPYYDSFLESTINNAVNAGVTIVAASGNCAIFNVASCDWDGSGTQNQPEETDNTPMYPAAFSNVLAVGASNYASTAGAISRSCYSNYGSYLDVVAPVGDAGTSCHPVGGTSGVRIPCGVVRPGCVSVDSFVSGAGTSYAAPMVTAAVGLLLSLDSSLNQVLIKDLLQNSSTDVGASGRDDVFGSGVLNVGNMMQTIGANYIPTYYFPWYDTKNGNSAYTLVGNPSTTTALKVKLSISGTNYLKYATIAPGGNLFYENLNILTGPVVVSSENGAPVYTTQRVEQILNGVKSFNEYAGIPATNLTNKYYFPWYDTKNGNSAYILIGNPSTTQTANIQIKIAGNVVRTGTIAPGGNLFNEKLDILGGPVEVTSDINVYTTQRVEQILNGVKSFNEYAGIPATNLTNKYYFPWYDT